MSHSQLPAARSSWRSATSACVPVSAAVRSLIAALELVVRAAQLRQRVLALARDDAEHEGRDPGDAAEQLCEQERVIRRLRVDHPRLMGREADRDARDDQAGHRRSDLPEPHGAPHEHRDDEKQQAGAVGERAEGRHQRDAAQQARLDEHPPREPDRPPRSATSSSSGATSRSPPSAPSHQVSHARPASAPAIASPATRLPTPIDAPASVLTMPASSARRATSRTRVSDGSKPGPLQQPGAGQGLERVAGRDGGDARDGHAGPGVREHCAERDGGPHARPPQHDRGQRDAARSPDRRDVRRVGREREPALGGGGVQQGDSHDAHDVGLRGRHVHHCPYRPSSLWA